MKISSPSGKNLGKKNNKVVKKGLIPSECAHKSMRETAIFMNNLLKKEKEGKKSPTRNSPVKQLSNFNLLNGDGSFELDARPSKDTLFSRDFEKIRNSLNPHLNDELQTSQNNEKVLLMMH